MPTSSAPYTSGPPDSPIVLLGEAPGRDEELHGGAFIGAAGKLLTDLCTSAGINRTQCYIDNVFQFRPKNNDLKPYLDISKKTPRETPVYLEQRSALLERLSHTSAHIIVCLGGVPTYALTGRTGITKQRGSILQPDCVQGRKVLCAIHPSAALREYLFRYLIVLDLQRALENSRSPDLLYPQREFILSPSFTEALSYLDHCSTLPLVAYDIETRGHELSHISFAASSTSSLCIPFVDGPDDVWNPSQELELLQAIGRLLENPSVQKVGQNLTFDTGFLYSKYKFLASPLHDTMIAQGILFPDYPKGLDFLTSVYCNGEPYYKDDGKEWFRNPFANEETFRRYNAMDSAVLMDIWPQQIENLKRQGNWDAYQRQLQLIHPLVFASDYGIRVNTDAMSQVSAACRERIASMEQRLYSLCGEQLNYNSPAQVQSYFYIKRKLRPHTKMGRITADDKALRQIAAQGHEEASLILDLRHESKMLSTYYGVTLDPDRRLRCSFNPIGTKQGRISSSKTIRGTGMNFQNQPSDMDTLFLADPGYLVVSQDLGQAENRVVAYDAQEHRMISAFETGTDIHKQTASLIFEIPVSEVSYDQRQTGKKSNHSLNYGQGVQGFATQWLLPLSQAKFIHTRYHQVYPGIREWHTRIRDELSRNHRTLTNCYGRKRTFMDRWGETTFKVAYSYIPQSTIADKMNRDGVQYLYYSQDLFPEAVFLNTIHDSIRYQIPLSAGMERILEIISLVKAQLETPISWKGREFSIPVDTQVGFSFDKNSMLEWKAQHFNEARESLPEELGRYVKESSQLD